MERDQISSFKFRRKSEMIEEPRTFSTRTFALAKVENFLNELNLLFIAVKKKFETSQKD